MQIYTVLKDHQCNHNLDTRVHNCNKPKTHRPKPQNLIVIIDKTPETRYNKNGKSATDGETYKQSRQSRFATATCAAQ